MTEQCNENNSFDASYKILEKHAVRLRDHGADVKIDELAAIVTESAAEYKNAKARIDSVENTLNTVFSSIDDSPT
jgi:hypothetical protein